MKLALFSLLLLGFQTFGVVAFDASHARYGRILAAHVTNGAVDYPALKAAPGELVAYLSELGAVGETEFNGWNRPAQIAFLINLYNASTLRLIVDHYPVDSIRRIGGLFGSPWSLKCVRLFDRDVSLNYLEHQFLRPRYKEPRIHFALVCAARSCPPLRGEPFLGSRLEDQLNDQGIRFFSQADKNRVDPKSNTLWLSPIFDWYGGDFPREPNRLAEFVSRFLPKRIGDELCAGSYRVRYTSYDWALNRQEPAPSTR